MFKPSTAQVALLHAGESAASSAIVTFIIGTWQQIATGQISWSLLFTVFGSGSIAAFGLIYKSVLASPDFAQAESDTANQIRNAIEQRFQALENAFSLHSHPAPPAPVAASQPQITIPSPLPGTASVGVAPVVPIISLPQRSWNDSALIPSVAAMQPPPTGMK